MGTDWFWMWPATAVGDVYSDSRQPGANVQPYGCNGGANQKWVFISVGRGEYVIQNVNSGLVLEAAGGPWQRRAAVQLEQGSEPALA